MAARTTCSGVWWRPVYTTSMPASRSARATTFTPRSWPSSPALAMRMRIRGSFTAFPSHEGWLAVAAEHALHAVGNLLDRGVGSDRVEDLRHHVLASGRSFTKQRKRPLHAPGIAFRPELFQTGNLTPLYPRIDFQDGDIDRRLADELVDAHHDLLLPLQLTLVLEGGLGNLTLKEALLDACEHSAQLVNPSEVVVRRLLHPVGECLDEVRPAERVHGVNHPRLVSDDLLRPQRDLDGFLGGQGKDLIHGVGVQRLRAAKHGSKSFQRGPHDVVFGL